MTDQGTTIRGWSRLGKHLRTSLQRGFLVVGKVDPKKTALTRTSITQSSKGLFGFFPSFRVQVTGQVPIETLAGAPIKAAAAALETAIARVPETVRTATGKSLSAGVKSAVARVSGACGKKVDSLLEKFAPSLGDLVKTDRNDFRQKLLEGLGSQGSKIFSDIVNRHLKTIVDCVREDLGQDPSERAQAGPVALPTGTRFHAQRGNMTVFVVEQQPQTRTLRLMEDEGLRAELVALNFPYVVFFVVLRGRKSDAMYAFFAKEPLRSMDDQLYCPATPNIFQDFQVCFSPSASRETQAEMAEASIDSFWGGRFIQTHDPGNYTKQISIENWALGSRRDALFGLKYRWRSANRTVGSMLKTIDADFLKPREVVRGTVNVGRIQRTINEISETIANEFVEKLFKLVPGWNLDGAALLELQRTLQTASTQFCEQAKAALTEEVNGLLTEDSVQTALENAMKATLESVRTSGTTAYAAAETAVKALAEVKQ